MEQIENSFFDISRFDLLADKNSFIHRIDPRIKVITTLAYIFIILTFHKYQPTRLIPFILYPVILIYLSNTPFLYLLQKIVIVLPFALMIAIFNPILDKKIVLQTVSISITGGWISFFSILLRFFLVTLSSFVLIATTGFISLCFVLNRLGLPTILSIQLLFLYRYLFVLIEESIRIIRAHHTRAFNNKIKIKNYSYIMGSLLLRTIDRAERIYLAMLSRGFDGKIKISRKLKMQTKDLLFLFIWISFFLLARFINLPEIFGKYFIRWFYT